MMDGTPNTAAEPLDATASRSAPLAWFATCVVATVALSLMAAHAPPRVRLIGPFSIAFGLILGWIVMKLAAMLETHPSRVAAAIVAGSLTFVGLVGSTMETARLEYLKRSETSKNAIALKLIEGMKAQDLSIGPTPLDSSPRAEFQRHLERRVQRIGQLETPWPELIWVLELTAGTWASVWIARRQMSVGLSSGTN